MYALRTSSTRAEKEKDGEGPESNEIRALACTKLHT